MDINKKREILSTLSEASTRVKDAKWGIVALGLESGEIVIDSGTPEGTFFVDLGHVNPDGSMSQVQDNPEANIVRSSFESMVLLTATLKNFNVPKRMILEFLSQVYDSMD